MRTKKVSKQKPKAEAKTPANPMELLKTELYNIIREEDETTEKNKQRARKNPATFKMYKEKELFKVMESVSKAVKDLEIDIDRVIKILEDISSANKGIVPPESSEEEVKKTVDPKDTIVFSGDSYSISRLLEKLKKKYEKIPFSTSMARSGMFTSKKRPIKDKWISFLEKLVDENFLKKIPERTSKGPTRYKF